MLLYRAGKTKKFINDTYNVVIKGLCPVFEGINLSIDRGKLEELRRERDSFVALISGLDSKLAHKKITSYEKDYIIGSVTKGENKVNYLRRLNIAISALEERLRPSKKPYPHKKSIIISAMMLMLFLSLFFALKSPQYTGLVVYGEETLSTVIVNESFDANTITTYEFNIANGTNLTSLKITGAYAGRFAVYLEKRYDNGTSRYLVYESAQPDAGLITGMVAGEDSSATASNVPILSDAPSAISTSTTSVALRQENAIA